MNSERKKNVNINIKKLIRVTFITIAFTIILSFLILLAIDKYVQKKTEIVDLTQKIEHNLSSVEQSLYRLEAENFNSKKQLSEHAERLHQDVKFLLAKKIDLPLSTINDSSLYYFSADSNYSKDEIILIHLASVWNYTHQNLNYLIHSNITEDSTYRSYEEIYVWNEDENKEKIRILGIERHKSILSKEAEVKIEGSFININKIKTTVKKLNSIYHSDLKSANQKFIITLYVSIVLNLLILFLASMLMNKNISKPIFYINKKLSEFNNGVFNGMIKVSCENELGETQLGINKLADNILLATEFVKNIQKNNITEFDALNDSKNPLLHSLKEMSDELQKAENEERERNWIIEGQADFSELLSKHSNNFQDLVDVIISNLVKYIEGLQGAIFIVNKEKNILDLVSSFAYDRKKFVSQQVELGEGLIGQVWREEKYIQLDEIPEGHSKIKSGMGQASPKNILIVPLIDNQKVYGIIELASFKTIQDFQREFVLRISENIAATLSSVEINNNTQKLLLESQLLTEKMKEQEEEMTQNLEELQATQDDITRREFQKEQELKRIAEKLNEQNKLSKDKETELKKEIKKLKILLEESKEDNEKIRQQDDKINDLKKELENTTQDLNETIRIKDLKIQKMRKKINPSDGN